MFSATAGWLRHFTRLRSAHPNPVIVTVRRPTQVLRYSMPFLYQKFATMKSVAPAIFALLIVSPAYPDQPASKVLPANPCNTLTAMRSPDSSAILIAAHRGGYSNDKKDRAPENSLENIVNCQRKGYDLYETDIQRTSDGHFVIVHDPTIDRETTGTGDISETSLSDLKRHRKRYRDGSVSESRVATLGELLDAGRGRTIFKADLKPGVPEHFDDVLEIAKEKNALDAVVFSRSLPRHAGVAAASQKWLNVVARFGHVSREDARPTGQGCGFS